MANKWFKIKMLNYTKHIMVHVKRKPIIRKKFLVQYVRKQKQMIAFCLFCKGSGMTIYNTNKPCKRCYGTGLDRFI